MGVVVVADLDRRRAVGRKLVVDRRVVVGMALVKESCRRSLAEEGIGVEEDCQNSLVEADIGFLGCSWAAEGIGPDYHRNNRCQTC